MTPPLLTVQSLKVAFRSRAKPVVALDGLSFQLRAGEIAGLVGESGSGKSTVAASILRLLPWNASVSGAIAFAGTDVLQLPLKKMREYRGRKIAFVPQEPMTALNPTVRVGRQVELTLRQHENVTSAESRARAATSLRRMHVRDPNRVLEAYPFELSGGLRQRVLLASAFLLRPRLILADEPTTSLDVTVQAEILTLLRECALEDEVSVLLITHNMGVVWRLCDSVHVLRCGKIVETGETRSVLSAPAQAYTRQLLDSLPERALPRQPINVDR